MGDSELSLLYKLCKLWSGVGDVTQLSTGSRGFDRTSMSMYVAIQPENILRHLCALNAGDGFLDRFLLWSCRPKMVFTNTMLQKEKQLQEGNLKDFVPIFRTIYKMGKNCEKCYILSDEAQTFYDEMFDSYVDYMNKKYESESESDAEDFDEGLAPLGKDTIHVIRLACVLHILQGVFSSHFDEIRDFDVGIEINKQTIVSAHCLSNVLKQQKSIFLQSVEGALSEMVRLKKVKGLQERECAALIRFEGPACLLRDLSKRLKGFFAGDLKQELIKLSVEGFGNFEEVTRKKSQSFVFFKPYPGSLTTNDKYLQLGGFGIDVYTAKFNDISKITDFIRSRVLRKHPHRESLGHLLSQDSDDSMSDDEFHDA